MKKILSGKISKDAHQLIGSLIILHFVPIVFYMFLQQYGAKAYTELSFGEILWLHFISLVAMAILAAVIIIGSVIYVYRKEVAEQKTKKEANARL